MAAARVAVCHEPVAAAPCGTKYALAMSLKASLLAAALSLPPPWYAPGKQVEAEPEYRRRLETIVSAIAAESEGVNGWTWGRKSLAIAVLSKFYEESRFALEVHRGSRRGDRGRAICLGQHHRNGRTESQWEALAGTDEASTRRCARATVQALVAAHRYCDLDGRPLTDQNMARVFALYGTGARCEPSERARKRAKRWRRLMDRF